MSTIQQASDTAADGTRYDDMGPVDAPAIVLIHGLGLSRHLWDDHLAALNGYRVIRYDLYGHGDSGPPPETGSLSVYARQIADLLNRVCIERAHIVGFSIGGMINRRFAMDFPERLLSLVILNSPHDRGADAQKLVEERAQSVRSQGAFATFDDALKRWFTPKHLETGAGPRKVRQWREHVDEDSYAQAAWVLAHGVRELVGTTKNIKVPSLVMTCENDTGSTPEMSKKISEDIRGAQLEIIPNLQHLGLLEQPEKFTGPIRNFVDEVNL